MSIFSKFELSSRKSSFDKAEYYESKFEDTIHVSNFAILIGGFFGACLWGWDWIIDPAAAPDTLFPRLAYLLLYVSIFLLKRMTNRRLSAAFNYFLLSYSTLLLYSILGFLSQGHLKGIIGFVMILAFSLLVGFPYSLLQNSIGVFVVTAVPMVTALFFTPNHDRFILEYAAFLIPFAFNILIFHFLLDIMYQEIYLTRKELRVRARTDSMTGLFNRGHFIHLCEQVILMSKRKERAVSMMYLDLDHFKRVNDRFGHGTGDIVIVSVATLLKQFCRESDVVSRMGGEEFGICLPETNLKEALEVAERIRESISEHIFSSIGTREPFSVTISIGLSSCYCGDENKGLERLLVEADTALYEAKNSGRNSVCSA